MESFKEMAEVRVRCKKEPSRRIDNGRERAAPEETRARPAGVGMRGR